MNFAVHKINKLKEDDRFIFLEMYIGLVGLNSNRSFISKQTYEDAKPTIEYMPICGLLNARKNDFLEHEGIKLKCLGVILSLEDNNYRYESIETEDGLLLEYVVVNGIIFKEYAVQESKTLLESMIKNTSLELEVLERTKKDGLFYINKFRYQSVVILGDKYTPGMQGCHLEVASDYKETYSRDIEKIKYVFSLSQNQDFISKDEIGSGKKINISLTKESADFDTSWGEVDKTELRNKILKASNYRELVDKCYLMVLEGWEDAPSSKLKYPVCMIKNNTLVLSAKGCQSALSYLEKNTDDPNYKSARSKLKKYYKILGLSTENFKESEVDIVEIFNKEEFAQKVELSAKEVWEVLNNACGKEKYKVGDYEYSKYNLYDYDGEYVYVIDYEDDYKLKAFSYTFENKDCKIDFSNVKNARFRPFVDEEEFSAFSEAFNHFAKIKVNEIVDEFTKEKQTLEANFKAEKETLEATIKEEEDKFIVQLEKKQNAIIKIGQELDALKEKFASLEAEKKQLEEQIINFAKEKKLAEAEAIFAKYSTKISEEEKKEIFAKLDQIEDIKEFEKEVKAFVCDKYEEELRNKSSNTTFSYLGIIKPDDSQFVNPKINWIDYYKEYHKENQ